MLSSACVKLSTQLLIGTFKDGLFMAKGGDLCRSAFQMISILVAKLLSYLPRKEN